MTQPMSAGRIEANSRLAAAPAVIERDGAGGDPQVKTLVADLRRSDERTRFALGVARAGVWEAELFTGQVDWSDTMHLAMGRPATAFDGTLDGMQALLHEDDRDKFANVVYGNCDAAREFQIDVRVVWPDSAIHWVQFRGHVSPDEGGASVRLVSVAQDITEQRQMELQLRQSQKMEAMGRLAGGVAHDFNNILTAILGYAALIETEPEDETTQAHATQIRTAAERAAALARQLLAFSRRQVTERRCVYLNEVIPDLLPMLGKILGEQVRIDWEVAAATHTVFADAGQLQQVVLNLAINAGQAMPSGGQLTIRAGNVTLGDQARLPRFKLASGEYVMLSVTDTGSGMDAARRDRMFESCLTAACEPGRAAPGLTTVCAIVKALGGGIMVSSAPAVGTTFRVYLPRTDAQAMEASLTPGVTPLIGTGETVLVVEEGEAIQVLVSDILSRNGYTVVVAANADDALELVRSSPRIDLVVTDVMMPDGSGPELMAQLRTERPLRALYMSGYAGAVLARQGQLAGDCEFLQKPFTGLQLIAKVSELINRSTV
jgi:two-component system, cell cycle sensor histidine kinase and response regulator CckA